MERGLKFCPNSFKYSGKLYTICLSLLPFQEIKFLI